MSGLLKSITALLALLLVACTGTTPRTAPSATVTVTETASPSPSPEVSVVARTAAPPAERLGRFRAVAVARAEYPAGIAVAPDGRIFYSELYRGRIRVIRDGRLDPRPWFDVNEHLGIRWTEFFHGGLTGLAFDPEFSSNRVVYAVTQVPHPKTNLPRETLILRFRERGGRGTAPKVLLRIPALKFDNAYSVVFGPDGMLYIPSGQNRNRPRSREVLDDLLGKVLRVTRDGRAPGDNPFAPEAPLVWATGIRNAFDIAFDPATGWAVAGENGTTANDEINLLMPGRDYGHPKHRGAVDVPGVTPPLLDLGKERAAPTGIAYYDHERFPSLRGRFLMCNNHGQGMQALLVETEPQARLERLTRVVPECSLDLAVAPDGEVYFSDPTTIYRLARA